MSCERGTKELKDAGILQQVKSGRRIRDNILSDPIESILRLFIMTIGEFTNFYRELTTCPDQSMAWIGKFIFLMYELMVSLMQFNLLIAMMTRTYEEIYRTQKEWKRQVCFFYLLIGPMGHFFIKC